MAPGYMNAGQRVSGRRAVGHACLSWMPFPWVKKRAADSVAPGNTAHFGYGGASRWVHLYLRRHRCFQVLLEMTMATLAWGGFTLFHFFFYVCIELVTALQWLLFVWRRLQIQIQDEMFQNKENGLGKTENTRLYKKTSSQIFSLYIIVQFY